MMSGPKLSVKEELRGHAHLATAPASSEEPGVVQEDEGGNQAYVQLTEWSFRPIWLIWSLTALWQCGYF